jgi:hypothetical protein
MMLPGVFIGAGAHTHTTRDKCKTALLASVRQVSGPPPAAKISPSVGEPRPESWKLKQDTNEPISVTPTPHDSTDNKQQHGKQVDDAVRAELCADLHVMAHVLLVMAAVHSSSAAVNSLFLRAEWA